MSALMIHIAAVTVLLAAFSSVGAEEPAAVSAVYWSLMPIVGALGASLMAFLLNRVSENRKAVAGRVICSMAFGVGIPRALTYSHPWVKQISLDPILLIMVAFGCGLLGYAAAVHVVDKFFKLAPGVVDKGMEQLAEAVSQKVVVKTAENVQAAVEAAVVSKQTEKLTSDTPTTRFNR